MATEDAEGEGEEVIGKEVKTRRIGGVGSVGWCSVDGSAGTGGISCGASR